MGTVEILGTGAEVTIKGSASALTGIGEDGCFDEAKVAGQIEACAKILYKGLCVGGGSEVSLECTRDLHCPEPPAWSCDDTTECCENSLKGFLNVTRTFETPPKKFGPAECSLFLEAKIEGSGALTNIEGPGCDCEGDKLTLKSTLSGKGGGKCSATAFGRTLNVEAGAGAGACGGRSFSANCTDGNKWITGAFLKVFLGPIKVGWVFTFEFNKTFEAGDSCEWQN